MISFRLIAVALLALLPRNSFSETEFIDDALVTMEEVSAPPVYDVGGLVDSTGEFILQRSQLHGPGQAGAYWHCTGGAGRIYSRLMVFEPNVPFDEIAIDTYTWQDPIVDDWNATLNVHAFQRVRLPSVLVGGGAGCSCVWFQLNLGEWLRSNSKAGSAIAIDLYKTWNVPPDNWWFPPKGLAADRYLPPDFNPWMIQKVYDGNPLLSVSSGWHPPTTLEGTSLIKTKNRYLRIKNTGGPVFLRAFSNSPEPYGIVAYLFKENPDPTDQQDDGPINPMALFTSEVSDVTEATAMTFTSIPEGYYYSIFIRNNGEDRTDFISKPPYRCTMGPNGLSTKYDITYSLQTCAEAACNAGAIAVYGRPPSTLPPSSVGKAVAGRASMLLGFAALFAIF